MDEINYYSAILQNNTFSGLIVGQKIVVLKQIDSTNSFLRNELSKSKPLTEGTVIMAEEQFAGRGQRDNQWFSAPGLNLTFSILLCPGFINPENQFMLNVAVSLGINDTLRAIIGDDLRIKWPNDIYVRDQKLGGVLIENIVQGKSWKHAIVGIGLNVNQVDFDPSISNVTSLRRILHQDYDLTILLDEICRKINRRYLQIRDGGGEYQFDDYVKNLYRLNEIHSYLVDGVEVRGRIVGISREGLLQVNIDGAVYCYGFKEIAYIIP